MLWLRDLDDCPKCLASGTMYLEDYDLHCWRCGYTFYKLKENWLTPQQVTATLARIPTGMRVNDELKMQLDRTYTPTGEKYD